MNSYTLERRIKVFDLDNENDLIEWTDVLVSHDTQEEHQLNHVSMSIDTEMTYNVKQVLEKEFSSIKQLFSQTTTVHLFPELTQ
jgi:hypothetical protein